MKEKILKLCLPAIFILGIIGIITRGFDYYNEIQKEKDRLLTFSNILKIENVGQQIQLELNSQNQNQEVIYEIADSNIVEIIEGGILKSISEGITTVTVTNNLNTISQTFVVVVGKKAIESIETDPNIISQLIKENSPLLPTRDNSNNGYEEDQIEVDDFEDIKVTSIALNETNITLEFDKGTKLTATVKPSNATNKSVIWTSSNPELVSVDTKGNIKAIANKNGTATITATTKDGSYKASTVVTVNEIASSINVTGISLDKTNITLEFDKGIKLTATVKPSNATNKNVIWTSSNPELVSVDGNGNIKAIANKNGTATITATTIDGSYKVNASIAVKNRDIKVTGVSLNKTNITLEFDKGTKLTATIKPSNATNKNIIWSSTNSKLVTVDANGNIKAIANKNGTAIITATTKDGNYKASISVTVKPVNVSVKVTGVSLNKTSTKIKVNETETLIATVSPSNATNKYVTWSSSDATIATVSTSGVITGKKAGTATITATTAEGGKIASVKVTVSTAKIHFFKTGDSDAILLESNGKYGLVDTGNQNDMVKKYIEAMGITHLEFIIATHFDGDHIGGVPYLVDFVDSSTKYYYHKTVNDSKIKVFEKATTAMSSKNVTFVEVSNKYPEFTLGEFKILLMNTEDTHADEKLRTGINGNKDSIVAYVTYNGGYGTLLTGDMESQDEYRIISKLINKPVDVLKVAHHSWQSSTTMKFVKAISPKIAVVTSTYLLDDISTPVYYMQQKYGTKFYLTEKSDTAITIDYAAGLSVSPSKSQISNYQVTETVGNWRKLQNGIWFYIDTGNDLDSIVYDSWRFYNQKWYYLGIQGNMMTGFVEIKYNGQVNTYYLDKNGAMLTGWHKATAYGPYNNDKRAYYKNWVYSNENQMFQSWYQHNDTWANGKNWFYFEPGTGVMYHDLCKTIDSKHYCFDGNGICTTGC